MLGRRRAGFVGIPRRRGVELPAVEPSFPAGDDDGGDGVADEVGEAAAFAPCPRCPSRAWRCFDIPVLAEGIETAAQLRIVAREGCTDVQGYMIGRPERALVAEAVIRSALKVLSPGETRVTLAA